MPEPEKGKPHPNTCPGCGSHYRDDELDEHLRVCPQCGHHFPVRARARIEQLADDGSFVEEHADLRSEDPLQFFDLRPYTERLAELEALLGEIAARSPVAGAGLSGLVRARANEAKLARLCAALGL